MAGIQETLLPGARGKIGAGAEAMGGGAEEKSHAAVFREKRGVQ